MPKYTEEEKLELLNILGGILHLVIEEGIVSTPEEAVTEMFKRFPQIVEVEDETYDKLMAYAVAKCN